MYVYRARMDCPLGVVETDNGEIRIDNHTIGTIEDLNFPEYEPWIQTNKFGVITDPTVPHYELTQDIQDLTWNLKKFVNYSSELSEEIIQFVSLVRPTLGEAIEKRKQNYLDTL